MGVIQQGLHMTGGGYGIIFPPKQGYCSMKKIARIRGNTNKNGVIKHGQGHFSLISLDIVCMLDTSSQSLEI